VGATGIQEEEEEEVIGSETVIAVVMKSLLG
jgi:hypothetical protein